MEMTGIKVHDTRDLELSGTKVAEGFRSAYNCETKTKGVVDEVGEFHITLPLNGWRGRDLAEKVIGVRDDGEWTLGRALIVDTHVLQDLPGFDGRYVDYLNSLSEVSRVAVLRVAIVEPSYGVHIVVEPATEARNK